MNRPVAVALLALLLLAGCASSPTAGPAAEEIPVEPPFIPRVVVAILDTGVIPYHEEFRQVRPGEDSHAHPSTYLSGYPAEAKALPLSLDPAETDAEVLMDRDAAVWDATQQEQLYYLPGTKFVGMVGIGSDVPGAGHGSMTSSRAGGNTISIPGAEVLLVHVVAPLALEIGTIGPDAQARATMWMADQPFIDIQSHSWGMPFTCAGVATSNVWQWAEAFKYARDRQLVMVAAGNGHGNTGITPGYPSQCQDNAGIAGVVTVGGTDNDGYAEWANWFPAVAADGCSNPAVDEDTTNEVGNTGGGTSSATPFAAGGAARIVLEARRILRDPNVGVRDGVVASAHEGAVLPAAGPLSDGTFSLDELKAVLMRTATMPTDDPSDGDKCVTSVPTDGLTPLAVFPFIGYGEVNHDSVEAALQVLTGEAEMPLRPNEDELYARDQAARRAFWG